MHITWVCDAREEGRLELQEGEVGVSDPSRGSFLEDFPLHLAQPFLVLLSLIETQGMRPCCAGGGLGSNANEPARLE